MAYYTLDAQSAKDAADGEQAAAKSVGYAFCSCSRTIEPNEQNFTADVVQMKQNGVKGVMMAGDVGTMARMAKAMKDQGFSVPFANWGANAYDPAFISQGGDGAEGATIDQQLALYAGEDAGSNAEVALFLKWLHQVSAAQKPDIFAAFSWASARLFVQALQAAGAKATRAGLASALKAIDPFDDNGMLAPAGPAAKRPSSCYVVIKVQGGKFIRFDDPPTGFRCGDGDYFHLP
jgi:ABC-type branched-subunit amino acid transport system substrate-binding protein